jgi:multidrug efflux pump subunit AcrA (membrane-fusion protein)
MTAHRPALWRKLLILPPIVLGMLIAGWLVSQKQPPAKSERGEAARSVRVVEVAKVDLVPLARGYGPVRPGRIWAAVAQVEGRVVRMHPRLRDGEILPAGTELLRIDPADYELQLAQVKAELAELSAREENARGSLEIEERNLALAERELERKRTLLVQNSLSQSAVDDAERVMLATRSAVQNQRNTLALVPAQRSLLEARAAQARRDLAQTVIRAPFNMRVSNLDVEVDQFTTAGRTLFQGDAIDRVEIEAEVALFMLRRLVIGQPRIEVDLQRLGDELPRLLGFSPVVRLDIGDHVAEWEAEFVRIGPEVDSKTRTLGVVVAVDHPFERWCSGGGRRADASWCRARRSGVVQSTSPMPGTGSNAGRWRCCSARKGSA